MSDKVPPFIEGLLNVDIPDQYDHLVTVMTMILAIYGVIHTFKRIFPDKSPEKLQNDYDKLVVVAGDYINIPPQNLTPQGPENQGPVKHIRADIHEARVQELLERASLAEERARDLERLMDPAF